MNRVVKQIAFVLARSQLILTCAHRSRKLPMIDAADALSRQDMDHFRRASREKLTLHSQFRRNDIRCPTTGFRSHLIDLLSVAVAVE